MNRNEGLTPSTHPEKDEKRATYTIQSGAEIHNPPPPGVAGGEVSLPNQTDDLTGMPHCNCGQHGLRIIRSCCTNGGCWSGFRVPETAAAGAETPKV